MFTRNRGFSVFRSIVTTIALLWSAELFAVDPEEFRTSFIEHLEFGPAKYLGIEGHGMDAESIDEALSHIYHENDLEPLWVSANEPGKSARAIFDALKAADTHGLNPETYLVDRIQEYWDNTDVVGLVRLDILLSLGLRGYVADQREGRIGPRNVDPRLFATARDVEIDWKSLREQALAAPDMKAFLDTQVPPFPQYHRLRKTLVEYREIQAKGGWEVIAAGAALKPGMEDERVSLVRRRLAITGDLESDNLDGKIYDNEVEQAVKRFQSRHGLEADGVVGKKTLSAMNVPVDARIRQITINMERYRWIKHQQEERVIVVNIAGFRAGGIKNGEAEILMPVIVGREYHKTPVFGDTIKYIEFNPYWNVPPSIAQNEMLPKLKKNPHYLKERNFRVFDGWGPDAKELDSTAIDWKSMGKRDIARYRIRQDPGPKNALETVKFIFPNKFNVYLHDTPSHTLFQRTKRTFSHGCIRVSRPAELASYILGGEEAGWGIERVKEVIATGKRKVVLLKKPLPIYILYRTVVVGLDDEELYFYEDVYGRDALLEKALF